MNIQNKVAIVTGASSGIGLAAATLLTQKGAKVVLVARSKVKLDALSKKLSGSFVIVTDMAKEKEVRKMVASAYKHFSRIDIIVNNAGRGYDAAIESIEIDKFHEIFDLNLVGPVIAMQEVIPIMRKQKEGAIVNISSGTALMAFPHMGAYSSLKRALVGISLTAREELSKDTIRVSVVYPTMTATDFEKNTMQSGPAMEWEGGGDMPKIDPPELIAECIVEAIETGKAEIFAHDWMGKKV
ncbi:MAG TPA: SDR family oxidoreductase [Patescibacteria group bacterium]|jgi:short-subunit dehydrogenase|nr:SDR family oxidoreductase [Patescibacteria group bacterium]